MIYSSNKQLTGKNCFGMVDVHLSKWKTRKCGSKIFDSDRLLNTYRVSFKARKVQQRFCTMINK